MWEHLSTVDSAEWPGIANPPAGRWLRIKARRAEADFARACQQAGITVGADADLHVEYETMFDRIATSGWTGLAESFMAGEWAARDNNTLVTVLRRLLAVKYNPSTPKVPARPAVGQLPPSLVRLFAGDTMSAFQGTYASGVATTVRESVPSHVPGAGRGREPSAHFVDITNVGEPVGVDRADLADAQARAARKLLDAAHTRDSSHVLVYPASGGQVEIAASQAGATVDSLTTDPDVYAAMQERLLLAGSADDVHVSLVDSLTDTRGQYDVVVSMEHLETMAGKQRVSYVQTLDRVLAMDGRMALQTVVATPEFSAAAASALQALRAYIWPGLTYATVADIHRLCDKHTNLRITGQAHLASHHVLSIAAQRAHFAGHLREAAAEGFDQVYRRLIDYQFALRQALMEEGMTNGVVLSGVHRHRGGRR